MTFRSIAFVALSVLAFGCSANAEPNEPATSATSNVTESNVTGSSAPSALLKQTIVKGSLDVNERSTVGYEPDLYQETQIDGVPYLAWELTTEGGRVAIDVEGDFPSTPDVLLVDADFNLLAQARGSATDLGDKATLQVDATPGTTFILVRDMEWVRPMDFEISVAE